MLFQKHQHSPSGCWGTDSKLMKEEKEEHSFQRVNAPKGLFLVPMSLISFQPTSDPRISRLPLAFYSLDQTYLLSSPLCFLQYCLLVQTYFHCMNILFHIFTGTLSAVWLRETWFFNRTSIESYYQMFKGTFLQWWSFVRKAAIDSGCV